jgi:hypothetical protein
MQGANERPDGAEAIGPRGQVQLVRLDVGGHDIRGLRDW